MRVIAGQYRRRRLFTLPGEDITRPTADRVKESLFNILSPDVEDAAVFDLFAGSGALGIEALSRGAKKVLFVEKNRKAIEVIEANLKMLQVEAHRYQIVASDVSLFLRKAEKIPFCADIVIADPPYDSRWREQGLAELEQAQCCSPGCLAVFEMAKESSGVGSSSEALHWQQQSARRYGRTVLEFWQRVDNSQSGSSG